MSQTLSRESHHSPGFNPEEEPAAAAAKLGGTLDVVYSIFCDFTEFCIFVIFVIFRLLTPSSGIFLVILELKLVFPYSL